MINRDFLKRLTKQVAAGNGGWYPQYMFYLESNSQLVLSDKRVSNRLGLENTQAFNNAFSPNGVNEISASALGGSKVGNSVVFEHVSAAAQAHVGAPVSEIEGGMKHAAVIQNFYNYAGPGDLQDTARIALVAAPLDPAVAIDPIPHALNYICDLQVQIEPDVRLSTPNVRPELAQLLALRLRETGVHKYGPYDGSGNNAFESSDSPYALGAEYYSKATTTLRFFITSSNLDVSDESKLMRMVGHSYGFAYDSNSSANADILRVLLLPHYEHIASFNKNCILLSAEGYSPFYIPVLAHLSAARVPTAGVSAVQAAPWYRPSCHVLGFSAAPSSGITATSPLRAPRSTRTVVTIDRGGIGGVATYKIERYQNEVIEAILTSHLPYTQVDGSEASYFNKGTYNRIGTLGDQYDSPYLMQPVAFASAQEPESPWLYYVSLDEDDTYWLNRQELGKAHVSESLLKLAAPPTQMHVLGDRVWMLYGHKIVVFRQSTSATVTYGIAVADGSALAALAGQVLSSIAIDREQSRVWVGHSAGIFEMVVSGETVTPTFGKDLSKIGVAARAVARCSLRAVNGYVAWTTQEFERPGIETETFVCRYVDASNSAWSWDYNGITDGHIADYSEYSYAGRCLYGVGLRSNGDMLVVHSPNTSFTRYTTSGSMSWCRVRPDNGVTKMFVMEVAFPGLTSTIFEGTTYRFSPLHRIDDNHFTGIQLMYNPSSRGWYAPTVDSSGLATVIFGNSNNHVGHSCANDFHVDDAMSAIYSHPQANAVVDPRVRGPVDWQSEQFQQHPTPIPRTCLVARACDALYAVHSATPIIIDKSYSLLVCGMQYRSNLGVELDWDGTNWVHATAGREPRARTTHTSVQALTPWLSLSFSAGTTYDGASVFRVDTFPSTSTPARPDSYMYLGDYIVETATLTIAATTTLVPAKSLSAFYGVDIERSEDLACLIAGTPLTYVPSTLTPGPDEFSMTIDSLVLNASRIGATATLTYNFVKQAEQ